MNDSAPCIVAVGDLTADLVVEVPELPIRPDDFRVADAIHLEPGGSANLLILLARLGAAAVALGALGTDLWGEQVYQILESEAVDVSPIRREGTTTVALVLVDSAGRHSFVGAYGKGKPQKVGGLEKGTIAAADALFASGYSLAEERLRDLTLEVFEVAGQRGVPRFFDPGPAFKSLPPELQRRTLAFSDVLLLTEEELRELSKEGAEELLRHDRNGRQHGSASSAPDLPEYPGPRTIVVKRGAAGCRVYTDDSERVDVLGLPVTIRDTTAAGDCFDAGYIWAHLKGRSPEQCARLANAAGAVAVGKLGGGRNVPTVEELREMISRTGGGIEI
jgi:sugar/nucleoside kinase (ribokinase family)